MQTLIRKVGGREKARAAIGATAEGLGLGSAEVGQVLLALALCESGMSPEEVSKQLDWKEFERFCAGAFRTWGFVVRENVVLTKPRAQIDLLAYGSTMILSVDCKHYAREPGPSALAAFAKAQLKRSSLLRAKTDDPRPIASIILSMSETEGRFVEGVAVVPIRTLRSLLTTVDSYSAMLDLR